MDGVIIDSEPQHGRAALKVLHKYGADADMSYHEQFIGSSTANMAQKVISDFSLSLSPEELLAELNQAKREIHKEEGYPSLPGICELIPKLAASGWKLAIASSSNPAEINAVVSSLGIRKYFDQLVSSSNVAHPKPAPDTFQLALKKLGVSAEEAIVVEDSSYGVEAAIAARNCLRRIRQSTFRQAGSITCRCFVGKFRRTYSFVFPACLAAQTKNTGNHCKYKASDHSRTDRCGYSGFISDL